MPPKYKMVSFAQSNKKQGLWKATSLTVDGEWMSKCCNSISVGGFFLYIYALSLVDISQWRTANKRKTSGKTQIHILSRLSDLLAPHGKSAHVRSLVWNYWRKLTFDSCANRIPIEQPWATINWFALILYGLVYLHNFQFTIGPTCTNGLLPI